MEIIVADIKNISDKRNKRKSSNAYLNIIDDVITKWDPYLEGTGCNLGAMSRTRKVEVEKDNDN